MNEPVKVVLGMKSYSNKSKCQIRAELQATSEPKEQQKPRTPVNMRAAHILRSLPPPWWWPMRGQSGALIAPCCLRWPLY